MPADQRAQMPTRIPLTSPAALRADVETLATRFVPRDAAHSDNLRAAADFIAARLQKHTSAVSAQAFKAGGETYRNVIARFGPADGPLFVVGAHYDVAGPYPGADDNASGVAGLLALAERLVKSAPAMRVELVAFCLEEPPYFGSEFMGSQVYAQSLKKGGESVRGMMSLEMIGYFDDRKDSQQFPHAALKAIYPDTGNFIAVVGRLQETGLVQRVKAAMRAAADLQVHSLNAPASVTGVGLSDHASFWAAGFPAIMITDTAFFRNPNYHSAADTPGTLDYRRMAQVVDGVYAAIMDEAGAK